MTRQLLSIGCALLLCLGLQAAAAQKVQVKGVHLCCKGCVDAVGKALSEVAGVEATCDRETATVTLDAKSPAAAKSALAALAEAGFHGETGDANLAMPDDSGAGKEKVTRLALDVPHNCCKSCTEDIKEAVEKVAGVESHTIALRQKSFVAEGNFIPMDLVKALNAAGFHVKVKKSGQPSP